MPDPVRTNAADSQTPDWSDDALDARCPLCDYNLRGLIDPRCPECGYKFVWRDLLDPERRDHPYHFELYRGNLFVSFWKTAFHALRPKKFWTTLRADQRAVPWRLEVYAVIVAIACLAAIASVYASRNLPVFLQNRSTYRYFRIISPRLLWAYRPAPYRTLGPSILQTIVVIGWPTLTFLSLMIFQVSMRRAKVKTSHVLRCVVYAADIAIWLALATVIVYALVAAQTYLGPNGIFGVTTFSMRNESSRWGALMWAWTAAILVFQYRLVIAYWYYLRFRQVIATIFASQLIVFLAMFSLIYYTVQWFRIG